MKSENKNTLASVTMEPWRTVSRALDIKQAEVLSKTVGLGRCPESQVVPLPQDSRSQIEGESHSDAS